ncbi:endoplasmic reticulum metallopeptidase 1 [Silurus meridionalis]|uniref:endoplasmic reticulum metallopeptidase 1 n=1 Tax=Silurus meridionalis TaxID=175797 RepID=UPI001EEC1D32|nr:endoplasmic reticulum metallopeptidase 1 [Silurus meridionalis]XP_046723669.1 endoplasmic reticulum metallopeptidase 1 [Silurus meridionalis]
MEGDTAVRRLKSSLNTTSYANSGTPKRDGDGNGGKKKREGSFVLSEGAACALVLVFLFALWGSVHWSLKQLVIGKPGGEFNATRARKYLEHITSVGPRPAGSPENDVMTVNFLLEQVERVRSESVDGPNAITVETHKHSGSFSIDFLGGFTSCYDQITNIVVRLEPKGGAQHFVLANCHFDSVPSSPGASDDAVSCAVMLEVLHSISNLSIPLNHGIIFLFNGAEENILQASHGFVTQHKWVKQIRAFVNMEAAGVGGKELVFQTGPENPWLVQAYVNSVKHPFASVVGQEVFQSGIIPSDTDFRIFRDFGNIPGIDLAFIENGYIYHTKYDTADRILTDSIQRAGDNILALLKNLVMTGTLADPSEYRHGSMVFFDVLGVTMVAYPARVGSIINYMVVIATLIYLAKKSLRPSNVGGQYLLELLYGSCVFVLSWFVALLTVLIVALIITLLGRSMFWFTHFHTSILLYGAAAAGKILLIHTLAKNLYFRNMRRLDLGDLFFDVSLLLWCCALVFLTQRGLCSAYVPMLMVFFPLATKLLLSRHFLQKGVSKFYIFFYLLGLSFPYVHLLFLIWIVFEIFTPILGRSGTEIPPDVVLASLIAMAVAILSSFLIHFLYLAQSTRRALAALWMIFAVMLVLVSCGLFFPYSGDPANPRPKRVIIQHISRTFHALDGSVEKADSGYWINSFDYTGMNHITPHVPEINDTICIRCSDELPYCGFPWFLPVKFLIKKSWYLPAPAVSPKSPLEFKLLSKHVSEWGSIKLSFEVKGPSHMSLYVLPHTGSSLSGWSFADGTPQYDLDGEYFIYYSHGVDAGPWTFWIEVQPPAEHLDEDSTIAIAISTHYLFGDDQCTPELKSFLRKFPDWAFATSWVSTYDMYLY